MHDEFWSRIDRRLADARASLADMERCLRRPERTHSIIEGAGAIVGHDWQSSFYSHVGTFLAKARSVPWIIETCFGEDRRSEEMDSWWQTLSSDEQQRRKAFSDQFRAAKKVITDHPLTTERNVCEHRLGSANVEGKVVDVFGELHTATPSSRIPDAVSRPLESGIADDPALQWAATQSPQPIRPRPEQFTIAGKPLFPECQTYLALAQQLTDKARAIAQGVHGNGHLTRPPSDRDRPTRHKVKRPPSRAEAELAAARAEINRLRKRIDGT